MRRKHIIFVIIVALACCVVTGIALMIHQTRRNLPNCDQYKGTIRQNVPFGCLARDAEVSAMFGKPYFPAPVVSRTTQDISQATTSVPEASMRQKGILPNPQLTPGATNPDITQTNISQNICNLHWTTRNVRPSSAYTTALKKKQLASGYAVNGDMILSDYEEDHLIPLEIGGNPKSEKNLWPESYLTTPNAYQKDLVENYLHAQVCSGKIKLTTAQQCISRNWTKCMP